MDAFANTASLQYRLNGYSHMERIRTDSCSDILSCNLAEFQMDSRGRILEVNACIRAVCPGRRTAVAFELFELDESDAEHARGMKTLTLPAHNESGSRDILLRNIRFVLPEDDDMPCVNGERRFVVRSTIHYIDTICACPYEPDKKHKKQVD